MIKSNYDTAVLEKIAEMDNQAETMQKDKQEKLDAILKLDVEISSLKSQVYNDKDYIAFWAYISDNNYAKMNELQNDLYVANFWFPLKRF